MVLLRAALHAPRTTMALLQGFENHAPTTPPREQGDAVATWLVITARQHLIEFHFSVTKAGDSGKISIEQLSQVPPCFVLLCARSADFSNTLTQHYLSNVKNGLRFCFRSTMP